MNIINIIKDTNLKRVDTPANYCGSVQYLGKEFGSKKLGFHLETIDPKNFSCPYHYHTAEEELFYVLEGEAIVRCMNKFYKVGPAGKYWPAHALKGEV